MAYKPRVRSIQPSFFASAQVASMKPLARIAFAGLWTIADREGRLKYQPKEIKLYTVPYDDVDIRDLLQEMVTVKLILPYVVQNWPLIWIPGFKDYQPIHWHESESQLPAFQRDSLVDSIKGLDRLLQGSCNIVEVEVEVKVEVEEEVKKKMKSEAPIRQILDDLNELCGTAYGSRLPDARLRESDAGKKIRARWAEGYRFEDFQAVHRKKHRDWFGGAMAKYLRPATLYAKSHFDEYLNQPDTRALLSEGGRQTMIGTAEALKQIERAKSGH